MNRQQFKDILDSIVIPEGYDEKQLLTVLRPLNVALLQMIPERLYKYRSCCRKHIDALKKDEVWMSTSDLFNDPFDTLINYDIQEVENAFAIIDDPQVLEAMSIYIAKGGTLPESINNMFSDEHKIENKNLAKKFINGNHNFKLASESLQYTKLQLAVALSVLPTIMQRQSTAVCFSENINSVLMWSHYSDYHKGFALGYNLRSFLLPNKENLGLFPVVYSSQRYNATKYLYYLAGKLLNLPLKNQDTFAQIKLLLYKSKDWEYEREWRLINSYNKDVLNSCSGPCIIRPNSIYYGCNIDEENRKRLHELALEKNLQEFQMRIDNSSMKFEVTAIELRNSNN